jgi:chromosome segregation ATPase
MSDSESMTDRLGRTEAEAADLRLRLKESLERERRLSELLRQAEEELSDVPRNEQELRQQIEEYAAFHRAVEHSFPWRILQLLRRLVGREW